MSTQAEYAVVPRAEVVTFNTANTNRDGTGALAMAFPASSKKGATSRIHQILLQAQGNVTNGMLRLFIVKGRPGVTISSITFSGTTATVTTVEDHKLTTGDRVTFRDCLPEVYNVTDTPVTVSTAKVFTMIVGSVPAIAASELGGYIFTPATLQIASYREVMVTLTNVTATTPAWSAVMSAVQLNDAGYLPLILPAGYSLRIATHNAEQFSALVVGGDTK